MFGLGEFAKQFFLSFRESARSFNEHLYDQVATRSAAWVRHSQGTQVKDLAALSARWNGQRPFACQRRNFHFTTQRRLSERDGHLADQVRSLSSKQRMFVHGDVAIQVAARCTIIARLPLAPHPHLHPCINPRRDLHFERSLRLHPATSRTFRTRLTDLCAPTMTTGTGRSNAKETLRLQNLAAATTVRACDRLRARSGAGTLALATDFFTAQFKGFRYPFRRL